MKKATKIIRAGLDKKRNAGAVNTPVVRASTVVFESVAAMRDATDRATKNREKVLYYGRRGTPTHWTLQEALTALAGGADTVLAPSGLGACTLAILACVKAGDHILVTDSVYEPTRNFCAGFLKRFGVETSYYDPLLAEGVAALLQSNTTLVFCESPGSLTFEIQDIPAIAAAAHRHGAKVAVDNTWASPLFCNPLALGADLSIEAGTKYIVGHSDAVIGAVTGTADAIEGVHRASAALGIAVSPDDAYLATRGLRTLAVRLARHQDNALRIALWLQQRPEVKRVLYPALPSDPGHGIWKRDFSGASGLLGVVFKQTSAAAVAALIDGMELFPLGYSWGGFESLIAPLAPGGARSARPWAEPAPGIRLHIGLEDTEDLMADLDQGLARFRKAL
ncbi:MAG: cystathionine beta-lyase [Rhodospirillaceae bacterium]|nr:cystathionine beta-lyase [Rhodospirillaceae bacterium]